MTHTKSKQALKGLCAMSLAVGIGAAALTALPNDADATIFEGSFTIKANTSEPGLVIKTHALGSGLFTTPDILENKSYTFALFEIWTDESNANGNNQFKKPISVEFTFTAPQLPFDGTVEGETVGVKHGTNGNYHYGWVDWDKPLILSNPDKGDGKLIIELSNETFNEGRGDWMRGRSTARSSRRRSTTKQIRLRRPNPRPSRFSAWAWPVSASCAVANRLSDTVTSPFT